MKHFIGKKRKNSILRYKQIFALFFTFFVVFVVVSSVTYASMVARQKDRLKRQVEQSLSIDVNLMDQYIQRVHNATYKFLSRISVYSEIPPMGEYTSEDYRNISSLVEQMGEFYHSVSDYAYQVYFFSNDQHVITPDGTYEFSAYFDRIYRHDYYTADYWKSRQPEKNAFVNYPVDTVRNDSSLSVLKILPLVATWEKQQQTMTLVVEINSTYVRKMMADNLTLEGQSILCADQWGNALINTLGEAVSHEELMNLNSRIMKTDTPVMLENIRTNGRNYYVCGMQDISEMTHYILTPVSILTRAAYQTNQYLLGIFLGTMVMFFILTIFFSNKLFHPIQDILSSMELLKKDNSIAVKNWQMAESNLREQQELMEQYVNSSITLVRSSITSASLMQMEPYFFKATGLAKERLICMVLEFRFQDSYAAEFSDNQRKAIDAALPQALQALLNSRFQSYLTKYDTNCFVSFFNGDANARAELQDVLESLREVFQFDSRYCHISCGISEAVTKESGSFSVTVSQAFAAISQSYLNREAGNFSVVDFDADKMQYRPVLVQNDISRLYNLMRAGKKDELYAAVDEILQANVAQNVHYDTMKLICIRLYSIAADYLLACNLDPKITAEDYWDQIVLEDRSKSPEKAVKNFLGHCIDITSAAASEDENISLVFSYINAY